ncbi:baseplate protein [Geotalea uraniireducens]|uniref:Baseplate protein n=1 Tax=Geotalea uraniireducens TaxID=351604 RepID=A0ABN6VQ88_9BACT|nr:GPW/gp25 family protein [Geotalea uraniireducens]BDV42448.1 baseplate protein [Geotalea uraniireducens]
MVVRVNGITSAEWSLKLGSPGDVVEELQDIDQCIAIILTTRKGSDPHRPLFGCDAWKYLDAPAGVAIPNVIREAVDSLEEWEPRISLVRVTASVELAHIVFNVEWKLKSDDVVSASEVQLVQPA